MISLKIFKYFARIIRICINSLLRFFSFRDSNIIMKKSLFLFVFHLIISCAPEEEEPIQAAVVSARIEASNAGIHILKKGGNAFDAMAATSFALAVVYPQAGNITGGGFMVYRKSNGEYGSLDYREKAPSTATKNLYLDKDGNTIPEKSTVGGLAVGVPGAVAGILEVHQKFGSLPLETILQPAIELAEKGYVVTEKLANSLNDNRNKFISVNGEKTFFAKEFKTGDTIVNVPLAHTLKEISKHGNAGFYDGWVAQAVAKRTQETGGILLLDDLKAYAPKWRDPIIFQYKSLQIISMAPPSSGGICLSQMMKMIEPFDLKSMGHNSPETMHLMIEAERRSYADRSHFLGDPDFVSIPQAHLIDPSYLKDRMTNFDAQKATPSSEISHGDIIVVESDETTHFSIIDAFGNAVSVTTTLNGSYGSKVFVDELGVFLNNEMDDFSSKPGEPNMFGLTGSEANSIAPHKRMLSSMTPSIVEKDNQLYMIVGTPGGSRIITTVFQTILNVYEHGMNMQEAVDAPRFHHQWLPDQVMLEPGRFSNSQIEALRKLGHSVEQEFARIIGKVDAIHVNELGKITVGADSRGDDAAATY